MKGIRFDDKHTYRDFDLILVSVAVPNPEPKTYFIEIPGADGAADLTGIFGDVKYNQRTIAVTFAFKSGVWRRYSSNSAVANNLHGQSMRIILDDDAAYYYKGRINFKEWKVDRSLGLLSLEIIADPYKYELYSSLDDWLWDPFNFNTGIIRNYKDLTVNGVLEVTIPGTRKPTIPVIISNAAMTVSYQGQSYAVSSGRNKIYDISLGEGEHVLRFTGQGTISIDYQGGIF